MPLTSMSLAIACMIVFASAPSLSDGLKGREAMRNDDRPRNYQQDTPLTHVGRNPEANFGVVKLH